MNNLENGNPTPKEDLKHQKTPTQKCWSFLFYNLGVSKTNCFFYLLLKCLSLSLKSQKTVNQSKNE